MELRSVDPSRNRQRRYSITVQYLVDGGGELVITWGRLGTRPRQRLERFGTLSDLQRRYDSLLARRRRHGYASVATSPAVEPRRPLTVDSSTRFLAMLQKNGCLGVFDTRLHAFVIRDVSPDLDPTALEALARHAHLNEGSHVALSAFATQAA